MNLFIILLIIGIYLILGYLILGHGRQSWVHQIDHLDHDEARNELRRRAKAKIGEN